MAGYVEVVLPNGDVAGVTVERHGYRSRLWTSYKGIGYLGSFFGKSLKEDPNGKIVDVNGKRYKAYKRAAVAGVKYNGKDIEANLEVKNVKDGCVKLFALFLNA